MLCRLLLLVGRLQLEPGASCGKQKQMYNLGFSSSQNNLYEAAFVGWFRNRDIACRSRFDRICQVCGDWKPNYMISAVTRKRIFSARAEIDVHLSKRRLRATGIKKVHEKVWNGECNPRKIMIAAAFSIWNSLITSQGRVLISHCPQRRCRSCQKFARWEGTREPEAAPLVQ